VCPAGWRAFRRVPRLVEGFRGVFRSRLATRLPWARGLRPCDVTVGNVGFVTLLCRRSSQPGCCSVASLATRASRSRPSRSQGTGVIPQAQLVLQTSMSLFDVRLDRLTAGFLRATSQLTRSVAEVLLLAQPVAGHRYIAETQVSCRFGDDEDLLSQLTDRRRKLSYNVTVSGVYCNYLMTTLRV